MIKIDVSIKAIILPLVSQSKPNQSNGANKISLLPYFLKKPIATEIYKILMEKQDFVTIIQ